VLVLGEALGRERARRGLFNEEKRARVESQQTIEVEIDHVQEGSPVVQIGLSV